MALQPGTKLGTCEISAPIGSGGMGEVWRARDRRLDRYVALKVLPEAFISDADRRARFERETKVLASLNHPIFGSIHGLAEADGVRALVLEVVEGPTLGGALYYRILGADQSVAIVECTVGATPVFGPSEPSTRESVGSTPPTVALIIRFE